LTSFTNKRNMQTYQSSGAFSGLGRAGKENHMRIRDIHPHLSGTQSKLSRRLFFGAASAGTTLGAADLQQIESEDNREQSREFRPNPIPNGIAPLAPFGIFIHHFPVSPGAPLANINDPSNITDFRGFVGVTRIRGGGVGTDTVTGAMTNLAFQADMGFNQGHFVGTDGRRHEGSFAFV
jgi:hypothetical protein